MRLTCSRARVCTALGAIFGTLTMASPAALAQIAAPLFPPAPAYPCSAQVCLTPHTKVKGDVGADNFHALYSASCEGTNMVVTQHAPLSGNGCLWNFPAAYDFSTPDRYIYIAAWSDDHVAQGLLHDLKFNGEKAFSGSPAWRVYATGVDRDTCAEAPTPAEMKAWITTACSTNAWVPTVTNGPTNTFAGIASWDMVTTWYPLPEISDEAQWTWFDSGLCGGFPQPFVGDCNHSELLIFRLQVSHVRGYISADNAFNVYTADDAVENPRLTFRGTGCNWASSKSICFTTTDRYIYVFAWSDHMARQGLIHDLRRNGVNMFSDAPGWTVAPTGINLAGCSIVAPVIAAAQIWAANTGSSWVSKTVGATNGTLWPLLPCISALARWTWYESGSCPHANSPFAPGCDHDEFLMFRHELFSRCDC